VTSPRANSEQEIRRQLDHFKVLSVIDRAIAANFDLRLSLSEILAMSRLSLALTQPTF